jgi:tetratricopeptide (TPR) repeat protein
MLNLQRLDQWGFLPTKDLWPLLDERGRAAYASAVIAEFEALPSSPGDGRFDSKRFAATHRMEDLAAARADTDALIAVIANDLSSAYAYERIVDICEKANRYREALQWAERGLKAHPERPGIRLLLARQYSRAGLTDEALELHWQEFQQRPDVQLWNLLKHASAEDWPRYRARALIHISRHERKIPDGRRDASLRVRLLMADQDLEGARQLAAHHAIHPHLLEQLAGKLGAIDPTSAAAFIKRSVEATLPRSQPRDYSHQAQQVARVLQLDPTPSSHTWVAEIRAQYGARRKFIALLDAATATPHH